MVGYAEIANPPDAGRSCFTSMVCAVHLGLRRRCRVSVFRYSGHPLTRKAESPNDRQLRAKLLRSDCFWRKKADPPLRQCYANGQRQRYGHVSLRWTKAGAR